MQLNLPLYIPNNVPFRMNRRAVLRSTWGAQSWASPATAIRIYPKNSWLTSVRLTVSHVQEQPPGTLWQLHMQHSQRCFTFLITQQYPLHSTGSSMILSIRWPYFWMILSFVSIGELSLSIFFLVSNEQSLCFKVLL
jgi:hypothetical protein